MTIKYINKWMHETENVYYNIMDLISFFVCADQTFEYKISSCFSIFGKFATVMTFFMKPIKENSKWY